MDPFKNQNPEDSGTERKQYLVQSFGGIKGFTLFLKMKFSASRKIDIK